MLPPWQKHNPIGIMLDRRLTPIDPAAGDGISGSERNLRPCPVPVITGYQTGTFSPKPMRIYRLKSFLLLPSDKDSKMDMGQSRRKDAG